jgi:cytochrome oxidase assembly protein ShyY1
MTMGNTDRRELFDRLEHEMADPRDDHLAQAAGWLALAAASLVVSVAWGFEAVRSLFRD